MPPPSAFSSSTAEQTSEPISIAPTQEATASPYSSPLIGLARSDAFWDLLEYQAVSINQFESLEAMVERTGLIVVAGSSLQSRTESLRPRVSTSTSYLRPSRSIPCCPARWRRGHPADRARPVLAGLHQARRASGEYPGPSAPVLPTERRSFRAAPRAAAREEWEERRYTYFLPNFQAVLRDIDGQVRRVPMAPDDLAGFPSGLEGDDFDALVERVGQLGKG